MPTFFAVYYWPFGEKGMLECMIRKVALGFKKWSYSPGASVKINFDGAYDGRHF
ncbi:hypothetical protein Gorai_019700 [Gossypium raimondii]|uniref:Uncharacterized protein n=1 Tax=Gossypium raimondii TaxID=29730 RepID=A0A7J8PQ71_GOSRA|nr:hypothetical protein [Gossypium raimondii]